MRRLMAAALGAAALGAALADAGHPGAAPAWAGGGVPVSRIEPVEVARILRERREPLVAVDRRDSAAWAVLRLPRARLAPAGRPGSLAGVDADPGALVVLYGGGDAALERDAGLLRRRGYRRVRILRGGALAWFTDVLRPEAPRPADSAAVAAFREVADLSRYFGGGPVAPGAGTGGAAPGPPRGLAPGALDALVQDARRAGCGW